MNSNLPKSLQNKSSKLSSISKFANDTSSNPNISPINRVSILKTEEQKEIVRTNVFEPNDSKSGNNQQFTVVTEVIKRSSNISYDPQNISFNKNSFEFSFNQSDPEQQMNQSLPNAIIDINNSESNSNINKINSELIISSKNNLKNDENYQNKYKLLIKRIALQLKRKVREPTQGFFHFALQKGDYPLMVIRKIETQIINHNIEFSNEIFRIYIQKYKKYRELIKRIAHLLKISMKNSRFWENSRYANSAQNNIQITQFKQNNDSKTESIQVKISKKGSNLNAGVNRNSNNNSLDGNGNGDFNTKINNTSNSISDISVSKKINIQKNKKVIYNTMQNDKRKNSIDNTHNTNSVNNIFNQKKIKSHSNKTNNFKSSLNYHSNLSQTQNSNNASHKMGNFINPFKITKDPKKLNFSKKIDNKPVFNSKTTKDKGKLPNVKTTEVTSINSASNKNEKIINVNVSKKITTNNNNNNKTNIQMMDIDNDANKMDVIKEENTTIQYNNNLSNNMNDKNMNFVNTFSNGNVDTINNSNVGIGLNLVGSESEPIIISSDDNEKNDDFNRINSDIIPDKKVEIFEEKNSIIQTSNNVTYNMNNIQNSNINNANNIILNNNNNVSQDNFLNNNSTGTFGKYMNNGNDINNINNININNNNNISSEHMNIETNSNITAINNANNINTFSSNNNIDNIEKKTNNNINIDLKKPDSGGVNSKNIIINMSISPSKRLINVQDNNNNNNNQEIINDNSNPIKIDTKNKKRISINYAKNTGKKIEIKFSSFKKSQGGEENDIKSIKSKDINKDINKDNIEPEGNDINISNQDIDSIMEQKWEMNTNEEKASIARKFNLFLSKNNIMVQFNIPTSIDENGKNVLRKNAFWEKYIQYLYINYLVNNVKFSLFSFIQIIEQYFIWCEEINAEEIKKLIIQTIDKIYDQKEIGQFLSMNKIDNFEDLFKKYQIFMNIDNKNTNNNYGNYKFGKEIEIKIDNQEKCNCELCKSELACMKKMSEVNKNLITGVKIEDIFYTGKDKKISDNTNLSTDNYQISYEAKEKSKNKNKDKDKNNLKFTESKTKYSFELVYNYIPQSKENDDNGISNQIIEVEDKEVKESNRNSMKKEKSKDKSLNKNKKKQNKKKNSENFIDVPKDNKIYDYFVKENDTKENSDEPKEEENNKKDDDRRKKSIKKEKKGKRYSIKEDDDSDEYIDINKYGDDDYYNKHKKNKSGKAKKRNSIKLKDTESGSEGEEEPRNKNKKKEKSKPKNRYKIYDSESESDSRNSSKKKKKIQYPKVNKKKKGKNY